MGVFFNVAYVFDSDFGPSHNVLFFAQNLQNNEKFTFMNRFLLPLTGEEIGESRLAEEVDVADTMTQHLRRMKQTI